MLLRSGICLDPSLAVIALVSALIVVLGCQPRQQMDNDTPPRVQADETSEEQSEQPLAETETDAPLAQEYETPQVTRNSQRQERELDLSLPPASSTSLDNAVYIYRGARDISDKPFLAVSNGEVYVLPIAPSDKPVLTFHNNEIYRAPRESYNDNPIATVESGRVYSFPRNYGDEPIAVVTKSQVYRGLGEDGEGPIATVEGGGDIQGACAAAYLILLKQN